MLVELLFRFIAFAAPAIAWGLSLPVTPEFCLPRGWGRRLARLFVAKELAGLTGFTVGLLRPVGSLAFGCMDARRLVRADIDDCELRRRGRFAGEEWERTCCE